MFATGFKKTAAVPALVPAGVALGGMLAFLQNKNFIEKEILQSDKKEDTKSFFSKIKKHLPSDTRLLTNKELHKRVKDTKDLREMQFLQMARQATEGNAAAIPASFTQGLLFNLGQKLPFTPKVPDDLIGKNLILTDDEVHPAMLAHEAGHIIDYDDIRKGGFTQKVKNFFSLPLREERHAWDKAPTQDLDPEEVARMRKGALSTYGRNLAYPLIGAALGGAAHAFIEAKRRS